MKNTVLAAAALIAISSGASAVDNSMQRFPYWYLGLSAGVAFQSDSDVDGAASDINWDTGYISSVQLGYQPAVLMGLRPELEYSFRKQDFSGGDDVTVHVGAANLYYDFATSSPIVPYIGAGIGWGHFDLNGGPGGADGTDSQLIYQGMVGIGYEPSSVPNVGLTLGYRYMAPFSDPEAGGTEYEYDNHSVEVGAKFRF